jgi:hypothetical protein
LVRIRSDGAVRGLPEPFSLPRPRGGRTRRRGSQAEHVEHRCAALVVELGRVADFRLGRRARPRFMSENGRVTHISSLEPWASSKTHTPTANWSRTTHLWRSINYFLPPILSRSWTTGSHETLPDGVLLGWPQQQLADNVTRLKKLRWIRGLAHSWRSGRRSRSLGLIFLWPEECEAVVRCGPISQADKDILRFAD